jgi:hypothetical protein
MQYQNGRMILTGIVGKKNWQMDARQSAPRRAFPT